MPSSFDGPSSGGCPRAEIMFISSLLPRSGILSSSYEPQRQRDKQLNATTRACSNNDMQRRQETGTRERCESFKHMACTSCGPTNLLFRSASLQESLLAARRLIQGEKDSARERSSTSRPHSQWGSKCSGKYKFDVTCVEDSCYERGMACSSRATEFVEACGQGLAAHNERLS